MKFRLWIKACLGIIILALLAFWGFSESRIFAQRVLPRLGNFRIWPDERVVQKRVMVERVNIHIPDFGQLAKVISGKSVGTRNEEVLLAGIKYFKFITDWAPDHFDAYVVRGVCEYDLGNYAEAEEALKRALVLQSNYFWSYYDLGMLYFNSGVYQAARGFLEGALARVGSYDAKVLMESKVFSDLLRADEDRPSGSEMVSALRNLHMAVAASCFILGDYACAEESSDAGRKMMGGPDFLVLSGVASFQRGDDIRAVKFLTEAIAKDPSSGAAHFFLALSSRRMKDEAGFMVHYRKSMDLGFDPKKFLAGIKFPLRVY